MTITVHTISGAPRPWRVLLGLAFKGLDYELVTLQASKGEHKGEAFLAINPRGTVPVLTDGEMRLSDSVATLAWLDRAYPEVPLFGRKADEAALIWQMTSDIGQYLRSATDKVLSPIFFKNASEATPELLQAIDVLKIELTKLERALSTTAFICGDRPSAADAVAFPEVRLIQRAMDSKQDIMQALGLGDFGEFPLIAPWIDRVEAISGYAKTQPSHWQEAA